MKKSYLVNVNGSVNTFTTKKAAASFMKKMFKSGKDCSLSVIKRYSQSYINDMKYHYMQWKTTNKIDIYDAYNKPSIYKIRSFYRIKESITFPESLRVLNAGCQFYSTGSLTTDPENGNIIFRYDTAQNVRTIPVEYLES